MLTFDTNNIDTNLSDEFMNFSGDIGGVGELSVDKVVDLDFLLGYSCELCGTAVLWQSVGALEYGLIFFGIAFGKPFIGCSIAFVLIFGSKTDDTVGLAVVEASGVGEYVVDIDFA